MTIPRSKLSGLVLEACLLKTVVKSIEVKPNRVLLMSDSRSVVLVTKKVGAALLPYFPNRVAELHENMDAIKMIAGTTVNVDEIKHIKGEFNPTYLDTHSTAKLKDLGSNSTWTEGPAFLHISEEMWSVTTEPPDILFKNEFRNDPITLASSIRTSQIDVKPGLIQTAMILRVSKYTNNLKKACNILARSNRVQGKSTIRNIKQILTPPVSNQEYLESEKLILLLAMFNTHQALAAGRMTYLLPEEKRGLIVMTGRVGEDAMQNILGAVH